MTTVMIIILLTVSCVGFISLVHQSLYMYIHDSINYTSVILEVFYSVLCMYNYNYNNYLLNSNNYN